MKRILYLVILSTFFALTAFAQENNIDPYAEFSLNFIKSINTETKIADLVKNFDDSLKTDSLRIKLKIFKDEILKYKSRSEYYIVKIDRPFMFYNINIHDPKSKTLFGDLRLVFRDNVDFLIDDWIYFIEQDKPKESGPKLKSTPLPPPPPIEDE